MRPREYTAYGHNAEKKKKRKEKVSQSLPVLRLSPLSIVGQIGMYRFKAKLRYGFLSTYDEGITLKQELNTNTGVYELWYSPVIRNNTQSQAVDTLDNRRSQEVSMAWCHGENVFCFWE